MKSFLKEGKGVFLFIAIIALFNIECSKILRKSSGLMDNPETHYKQGMKYWDIGDYVKAEEEFTLARSLDKKFAPAVSGLALVTAAKAKNAPDMESEKVLFEEAIELADEAQGINSKIPEVYIAKAIILTMESEGKEPPKKWLKRVEREFDKALSIDPENSEAYYRRGKCYKKAFEFSKAADDFRKVLDINKDFTQQADEEWQIIQKIQRAAPGTDIGKKIAPIEKICRADIAALFISELDLEKLFKKKRSVPENNEDFQPPDDPRRMETEKSIPIAAVTDVENHWAKNFIIDIVNLSIRGLEPYPDHTFRPNDPVNRGEYAMMIEDILIAILGDESLATRYVGTQRSRFPDIHPTHPAYNAICTAVDKNIMDAEMNGLFGADKAVSGSDALLVIKKLKTLNDIE